ncbi:class I SAM-dependent methyltransferase [Myxococcota bacterium]|nr:class I SAM-dependent methyltransferase [Myxococcota bacterium]
MTRELLEISDLIVDYDAETLARVDVHLPAVVERLRANGQASAARIAAAIPTRAGVVDRDAADAILLRAHMELQRLSEEFLQGDRLRLLVEPVIDALRAAGVSPPYRVVDVGCGLGFCVRTLAATGGLGPDVELVGCDYNRALVDAAAQLAREEHLACRFLCANAFRLEPPAHVYTSTGVLHHFRGDALARFFEGQRGAAAFVHFDTQPSVLSPIGSWIFHRARMREPLARHDGVVSAMRTHSAATLLGAARSTGLACASWDAARSLASVVLRPMHAIVGLGPTLVEPFEAALGPDVARLGGWT